MVNSSVYGPFELVSFRSIRYWLPDTLWNAIVSYARKHVVNALQKGIVEGKLTIVDNVDGATEEFSFGSDSCSGESEVSKALIYGKRDEFWVRILLANDIGFAEAYMNGDFDTPDMNSLLKLYVRNYQHLDQLSSWLYITASLYKRIANYFWNHDFAKSVDNASRYNASNELFKAFLSQEMAYSCALWAKDSDAGGPKDDLHGKRKKGDLEDAQQRKFAYILKNASIKPGDRLLDIGCGWGGLAIAAAQFGCVVDGINLSIEMVKGASDAVIAAGLSDRVTIQCLDYRNMPDDWTGKFDAVVSIEMLEAVGVKNMSMFVREIDRVLKPGAGRVVLTASTYPEKTYSAFQGNDFSRKYHWPNGISPSPTSLLIAFDKYAPRKFNVVSVENTVENYPRTLREWGRRFEENWTAELKASLVARYPALKDPIAMERYRRKWVYMFVYMETAYDTGWLDLTCWTLQH